MLIETAADSYRAPIGTLNKPNSGEALEMALFIARAAFENALERGFERRVFAEAEEIAFEMIAEGAIAFG